MAATQALEAVRDTLSHLQRWLMQLELDNVERPTFLTNDCRRARRLRDIVEMQTNSDPHHPEIELDAGDGDLLASCCMFAVEDIENSSILGDDSDARQWALQNMNNLFMVARDFATSPVQRIEGPGRGDGPSSTVRKMVVAIDAKVAESLPAALGMPARGMTHDQPPPAQPVAGQAVPDYAAGPQQAVGQAPQDYPQPEYPGAAQAHPGYPAPGQPGHPPVPDQQVAPTGYSPHAPYEDAVGHYPQVSDGRRVSDDRRGGDVTGASLCEWMGEWTGTRNPLPDQDGSAAPPPSAAVESGYFGRSAARPPVARGPVSALPTAGRTAGRTAGPTAGQAAGPTAGPTAGQAAGPTAGQAAGQAAAAVAPILDVDLRRMKDPRLRSMMVLDLKVLGRSMMAKDHRMSAVHLSSLFEAMVTDVLLQRRNDLSLRGTPDTWKLQHLVPTILGKRFVGTDRNTLFHLVNCKNIVRPAVQLLNPLVVTAQTVEKMTEFVQRFILAIGLADEH